MKCVEVYKELYHQEPFDVAFCPYRISPLGAHIDHQYGKINGLAIDKGIHMAYHPKQNGVVELQSLNFPKRAQFFVNAVPEEKQGDWADHLRGAAKMLGEKYRLKVGLSGIIEGSLPIGGLSSSASVIICFLSALCKVNGILTNILTALYEPFGFSLLLSFLAMFFYLYAYEPQEAGKGWKSAIVTYYHKFKENVFFRKLFLLAFVTSMILFRTLLNRNLWLNPLSDVMGGWGIWETVNGERKLTTECIENVIMMMPFSAIVMWTFGEKIGNSWKKILWQSGKIAFIFSVGIELLQLFLRLGTLQLSDLFYNTVGGVVGGLVYYVAMKIRKHL